MDEFYNLSFSSENIVYLAVTAALVFLTPFAFWFVWQKKCKGELKLKYLLAGVLGFLVSARVLELGVHMFCIVKDNPVSRFINGNTLVFVIYGTLMAGVFEECGRYIILKYIMKKDKTRENAVLYGIGHAGIEVLAVILPSIAAMLWTAVVFSKGDVAAALETLKITEATAAAALPAASAAAQFGPAMLALTCVERLAAMFIHIGLTVIVFYGIKNAKKGFLPLAIALHMIADVFPALYQRGAVPMWLSEIWIVAWAAIIAAIAAKLYAAARPAKA